MMTARLRWLGVVSALACALVAPVATPSDAAAIVADWDARPLVVDQAAVPLVGNFGGDDADDVLWYGVGSAPDSLWIGQAGQRGGAAFTKTQVRISGIYRPFVADVMGDELDDIVWYAPGSAADHVWSPAVGVAGFTSSLIRQDAVATPVVLHDRNVGGKDDVLWYAPGTAADSLWVQSDSDATPETVVPLRIGGTYQAVVGDWNADGLEEPFWYAPGPTPDYRWTRLANNTFRSLAKPISGQYRPLVYGAQYDGDSAPVWDQIAWLGAGGSHLWTNYKGDWYDTSIPAWGGSVTPVPRVGAAGAQGILWGSGALERKYDDANLDRSDYLPLSNTGLDVAGVTPLVGDFDGNGWSDIIWWAAGPTADAIWYVAPRELA